MIYLYSIVNSCHLTEFMKEVNYYQLLSKCILKLRYHLEKRETKSKQNQL